MRTSNNKFHHCLDYTSCKYDYNLHKIDNICICQKTDCIYDHSISMVLL